MSGKRSVVHLWNSLPLRFSRIRLASLCALLLSVLSANAYGHEGLAHGQTQPQNATNRSNHSRATNSEVEHYFKLFTSLVAAWPLPCREDLIEQATHEHEFLHHDPQALDLTSLRLRRGRLLTRLTSLVPTYRIKFLDGKATLLDARKRITVCGDIPSLVLVTCRNQSNNSVSFSATPTFDKTTISAPTTVASHAETFISCRVHVRSNGRTSISRNLQIECRQGSDKSAVSIPVQLVEPAKLRLRLTEAAPETKAVKDVAGRITVQCSDGVCRYGGPYADKSTFTDKPVIYPPIGTWQKLPFFYSDQLVEMEVPPGSTRVTFERGFEHRRESVDVEPNSGETITVERSCQRMADMSAQGWVSGDTHVHWVTNAWNVDEPLKLLAMAQRAEDLKVANNLTLLQRYANEAFVKPSQAPMGPVAEFSGGRFHMHMGEEYRNEDLYGHLCLLNIDWIVQPIGTGKIIAGPDSLDYPINRTAIEACRIQGGISIEAHGTGGNKDVPVNVIHRLSDSLDQMEPAMYYQLLNCGFQIPLTNGSDHPARTLGIARAYVKVEGDFSYDRWIDGIRKGKTFTTSGPLLFLKVNEADIGDVVFADADESLNISAKVMSRDPIGSFQIVSNGQVLHSHETNGTTYEFQMTIPAKESRWIVARCSNRKDGREDFGFGNFNAITGPGIAHTSPVYVHVDRLPRIDPMAADFWKERMRMHADDIRIRGRFATEAQHLEAVGYIEQGIQMFEDLKTQAYLARSDAETPEQSGHRLANVVRRCGTSRTDLQVLDQLQNTSSSEELDDAVASLTLLTAKVISESNVAIKLRAQQIETRQGRPERFLIAVVNPSGITGPLKMAIYDPASERPQPANWCSLEIVDSPFTSRFLTGAAKEYKVIEFFARKGGQRDIRLVATHGETTRIPDSSTTDQLTIDVKWRRRSGMLPVEK